MDPTQPPSPWVHEPNDVKIDGWSDIPISNYWKNTDTGEIVVQFRTMTAVRSNNYVEKHQDPEKVESRFRKIKNLVSRGDVEYELDSVTVTGGRGIAKCSSGQKALQKAMEYMDGDLTDFYYE